jgi:ribose transport system ATP-binding protein
LLTRVKALDIRPPNVEARLHALSGGNQQKVALAKWLTHAPRILLLAEPTRGMDVGEARGRFPARLKIG